MLILMDIDATMIVSDRAGLRAMSQAGRTVFHPGFTTDGVDFSGRLDTLIIPEMLANSGVENTPANIERFVAEYLRVIAHLLEHESPNKRALPGVLPLLHRLRERDDCTLGLLTGNYQPSGSMKLRACGIDPAWFAVQVWCTDAKGTAQPPPSLPSRDELPPVAMAKYRQLHRREIEPSRVIVVGDSPHDVRCAKVNGCRSLAVATGRHALDELAEHGADHAVSDLSDVDAIEQWMLSPRDR